jgi:hypothetical protein
MICGFLNLIKSSIAVIYHLIKKVYATLQKNIAVKLATQLRIFNLKSFKQILRIFNLKYLSLLQLRGSLYRSHAVLSSTSLVLRSKTKVYLIILTNKLTIIFNYLIREKYDIYYSPTYRKIFLEKLDKPKFLILKLI